MKKIIFTLLLSCSFIFAFGQNDSLEFKAGPDTIWLMSGEKRVVHDYHLFEEQEYFVFHNNKGKKRGIAQEDIFSIVEQGGQEQVLYNPGMFDESVSIEKMRFFIQGEYAARNNFNPKFATISGFLIGAAAPFIFYENVGYSPLIPIFYSIGLGRTMPNTPRFVSSHLAGKPDDFYLLGYTEVIRRKRTIRALKAGGVGFAISIAAFILFVD